MTAQGPTWVLVAEAQVERVHANDVSAVRIVRRHERNNETNMSHPERHEGHAERRDEAHPVQTSDMRILRTGDRAANGGGDLSGAS